MALERGQPGAARGQYSLEHSVPQSGCPQTSACFRGGLVKAQSSGHPPKFQIHESRVGPGIYISASWISDKSSGPRGSSGGRTLRTTAASNS